MITCDISLKEIRKITSLSILSDNDNKYSHVCSVEEKADEAIYFIGKKVKNPNLPCFHTRNSLLFVDGSMKLEDFPSNSIIVFVDDIRTRILQILRYIEDQSFESASVNEKFRTSDMYTTIHETAVVDLSARIGSNVHVGANVYIGTNVKIGDYTKIMSGAIITKNVNIGEHCLIRENSVVGGNGFGIEKDEKGNNLRIPQLGGVEIMNYVEIGALNTVCSGTIRPTYIGNYVKTDDHVHIAHNDIIEDNCIITAGVILSGSVTLKENTWIGINASVKQGVVINQGALIGMAACVNKDVAENSTMIGNPAKEISEFVEIQKKISAL